MSESNGPAAIRATLEFDLTPEDIVRTQVALHRAQGKISFRYPWWKRVVARTNAGALQHTVITLTTEGVHVGQSDAHGIAAWSRYESAFETEMEFVLVSRGGVGFTILPKRAIRAEEVTAVRDLVRSLPAPTRRRTHGFVLVGVSVATMIATIVVLGLATGMIRG